MKVNIVMLVYNRHMLTHQALRTLYRNTPMEMFRLVVVDDESAITPKPISKEHKANFACLRIEHSKHITGQARNLGVYWAEKYWGRGDWLLLCDNDLYFTPHWFENLIFAAERPSGVSLIGSWNHPYLQPQETLPLGNGQCIKTHDAVAGACQLMRWETWDKYGELDAHAPGVGQSEDWAMCQKIVKGGGKVGSVYPRVVFNCGLKNSFGQPSPGADVMLKELQEAKKQYPDLYWE